MLEKIIKMQHVKKLNKFEQKSIKGGAGCMPYMACEGDTEWSQIDCGCRKRR